MVHEGEDITRKESIIDSEGSSFSVKPSGDRMTELSRVNALEHITKQACDRDLPIEVGFGEWEISKLHEHLAKEGNNAMFMHKQFKNVIIRWNKD